MADEVQEFDESLDYNKYPIEETLREKEEVILYPLLLIDVKTKEVLNKITDIIENERFGKDITLYMKAGTRAHLITKGKLNSNILSRLRMLNVGYSYANENGERIDNIDDSVVFIYPEEYNDDIGEPDIETDTAGTWVADTIYADTDTAKVDTVSTNTVSTDTAKVEMDNTVLYEDSDVFDEKFTNNDLDNIEIEEDIEENYYDVSDMEDLTWDRPSVEKEGSDK